MNDEMITSDSELTAAQKSLVMELDETTLKNIDAALLSNANSNWRKVAMIVSITMSGLQSRIKGIPDVFYSQRIRKLVESSYLESQGNLQAMRFSEVRLSNSKK